jgi:hypothetical protein
MNSITSKEQRMLGYGIVNQSQTKEVIWNVYKFMKQGTDNGEATNLNKVQNRVCKATGISSHPSIKSRKKEKITPYRTQIYVLNLAFLSHLLLKSITNLML